MINPYRIQPNEDLEIEDVLNKEEELINDKIQLLLFLLKKYLSNFYHGAERFHRSDGALDLMNYLSDIQNLKFDKCSYTKLNLIIVEKLRNVIFDINKMYSIHDINETSVKNDARFISISPFLYDLRTWSEFIEVLCRKHYSKDLKSFKTKTELSIKSNLNYLKINIIWNLNEEVHYLLSPEDFYKIDEEKDNLDIIKDLDFIKEKDIISYEFQQNNSHSRRFIFESKVFVDLLNSINLKFKVKTQLTKFDIQLDKKQLVYLYVELEQQLNFFDIETTKEIWCDVLLNKFIETKRIKFTPKNNSQLYYFFKLLANFSVDSEIKNFYLHDKFLNKNNSIKDKYDSNKQSFSKAIKAHSTFKGKRILDNIFKDIVNK